MQLKSGGDVAQLFKIFAGYEKVQKLGGKGAPINSQRSLFLFFTEGAAQVKRSLKKDISRPCTFFLASRAFNSKNAFCVNRPIKSYKTILF